MQNIGKIYNQEWTIPVRTPNLQIYIRKGNDNEIWYIRYNKNKSLWKIDNKLIKVQNFRISLGFVHFFLYLPPISDEYLYEIEKTAKVILDAKDTPVTLNCVYKRLKKAYNRSEIKPKEHYLAMLSFSKCFIRISFSDTLGEEIVTWRVHKDNLSTFKEIKKKVQNVYIDTTGADETVKLFYAPKPKEPKRPDTSANPIEKIPISSMVFSKNKPVEEMYTIGPRKKKDRKRASSI